MKKVRLIIDILMYCLFILVMGPHITENFLHEIIGTIISVLFIIHTTLNIKFYKILFKGKYNKKRIILTLVDILLLVCMIGMIISSLIISNNVFKFLNIETTMFGKKIHMLSNSWGFILMSLHVGLHIEPLIKKIKNKILYVPLFIIYIYGIYSFIKLDFINDMFLLSHFKMFNFNEHFIIYYLHVIATSIFIILTMYIINNFKLRKKEK